MRLPGLTTPHGGRHQYHGRRAAERGLDRPVPASVNVFFAFGPPATYQWATQAGPF